MRLKLYAGVTHLNPAGPRRWRAAGIPILAGLSMLCLAACDPIVTFAGANFPSWLLCMIVGAILTALVRTLLALARLEPYLGPLTVFYPSLIAMFAMIVWVIFFNRV